MYHKDDELETLERKIQLDADFTPHERETLREMMRVYRGWRFFGRIVRGFVVAVGAIAGAAAAIKGLF